MKTASTKWLLGACLFLTACGPATKLDVGLKQSGSDILFGRPAPSPSSVTLPPLDVNPFPNFPAPLEQAPAPLAVSAPLPSPSPLACPVASPIAFPDLPAGVTPDHPPAAGTYPFRYTSVTTLNPGAPNQKSTPVTGIGMRQVTAPTTNSTDNSYTFSVVETFNQVKTTNTYKVYPTGPAPVIPGAPATPAAGLYLQEQVQERGTTKDDFAPQPPILLMPFPASKGATFQGSGTDPINGPTTMTVDPQGGTIVDKARVDACGAVLDSWQVTINGHVVNARGGGQPQTFHLTLFIGTQYGALSLQDHLVLSGTDQASGQPMTYDVTATINQKPAVSP